ncbi:MAG: DUF2188 domain-containing protein [Thermoleophilaceae bacterium]
MEFAWDEWAQMGVLTAPGARRRWAEDPEALLLLTIEVARDDPRLFDEVLDWLVRNEPLISARRLRTLSEDDEDRRLSEATLEWVTRQRRRRAPSRQEEGHEGGTEALFRVADLPMLRTDPIFAAFGYVRPPVEPSGKSREPDLTAPINFAFRLRQLLGVGSRAEAVRYLLTADTEPATVADVAAPSGYTKRNVQAALTSLHAAGTATPVATGGEQRFALDRSRWAHLLNLEPHQLPVYRDWPAFFRAVRQILRWLLRPELETLSDYLRASRAADLLDAVRPELSRAGVIMSAGLGGEPSWTDLEQTVEDALSWLAPWSHTSGRPAAFEIVPGASEGYWWRLTTATGRIVASSAEAYASRSAARASAERLRAAPARSSFRAIADSGAYRWNIVAENGRVVAASTEAFATDRDAERAARDARDLIAGAAPPSDAASEAVSRARHVTLRPDGRWQVQAEDANRAASTHATQADAVRSAKRQALASPDPVEVVVHGRDGSIRSSDVVRPPNRRPRSGVE